jgi:hypothetical protein
VTERAFRFNHDELNRIAREAWDLRYPIKLERRKWTSWWGHHTLRRWVYPDGTHDREQHYICIRTTLSVRDALETVAHELEHSAQAERLGARAMEVCYAADALGLERGAEAAEERWRELLPCIRFTQPRGAA